MAPTERPYRVLRYRDFRLFWLTMLVSLLGSQMQSVALEWHIYVLTKSPLALGLMGLVRVLPIVVLSLLGGVVADRWNRRVVMFASQSAMTLIATLLAFVTQAESDTPGWIYAAAGLSAAATAFDSPARQAFVARLVSRADLPAALAMNLTMFHVAMIGGPALAGILIAGGQITLAGPSIVATGNEGHATSGLTLIYGLNAISFVGVLVSLVVMRTSGRADAAAAAESPFAALKAGLRFVFTTPIMVWTMGLDFFATFFAGAMSLLPIFADQILHVGPVGYGWLRSAPALGALGGGLFVSLRPLPTRQGRILLWAVVVYGLATVVFGVSRSFWVTLAALTVTGVADLLSTVVRTTLRQLRTPDALRGRMISVNMIFFMGGPQLGELEAGVIASLFASAATGAVVSVVSGGLATILVAAVVARATPVVRHYVWPPAAAESEAAS